ncbi:hypothetical protein AusDCA_2460 [Desulfitobacterium sp. AusDCA]
MCACHHEVTLYERAWIEIALSEQKGMDFLVTLYERAWIEIPLNKNDEIQKLVTLYERAWIEIDKSLSKVSPIRSLSTRERGLKYFLVTSCTQVIESLSTRERGLKFRDLSISPTCCWRHSLRESVD